MRDQQSASGKNDPFGWSPSSFHLPTRKTVSTGSLYCRDTESAAQSLKELLCCLPRVAVPEGFGYDRVFRVIIMQFIDAQSFDVRSVKKTCVHIVHPDGRLIPFDTYNLFYRDNLERDVLGPLRARAEAASL